MVLESRGDIRQKNVRGLFVGFGEVWIEGFEHAQFGGEGAAIVHVSFVFACPMKGFTGHFLEAVQVNVMLAVEADVLFREIIADNADQINWSEETGSDSGVA